MSIEIEILRYNPTRAPYAFAYVDLRIGPLLINGINLRRDGTITGGLLLYTDRAGKKPVRKQRPSIELPQDHEWMLAIRAAIERHTAGWTIEQLAPPALSETELEAKRQKRRNWELQQKIIADKKAAGKKLPKPKPAAKIPPALDTAKEFVRRGAAAQKAVDQIIQQHQPPPPRARIEPGKPLLRPPMRKP